MRWIYLLLIGAAVVKFSALDATAAAVALQNTDNASHLLIPVEGTSAKQLTDTFREGRGTMRSHDAIDILAPTGTRVLAVADGRIVKLFNSKRGGLTIYQFDSSEKLAYYYAHLNGYAIPVKEGLVVKRGDLLGYVGTTGNANVKTPHLHFAIFKLSPEKLWWKGSPINPYPLLGGIKN